jgi:hypothetical protein
VSEGIEFLLELQANVEGAVKMVRELTKVTAATHQADAALKAAEKHTTSLGGAFHKGTEWVGEFGREAAASFTGMFAATAVYDGIKEGIHLLGELALEALHAAGEGEQVRVAYENMLGVKPAGEMLEYFHGLAKASQFTDDQIAQLGGALTRAGYEGVEFRKAMAASLDIAALPGAGDAFSKAAEGIEIFSRIALKGGIGARELVRAGVNTKSFYKDVSEQTGLGLKAVEEQLQQGKINVEIIRESIFRAMQKKGGKIGDADFAMSKTLLAQTNKVKDIIPNLFKDLESTGGIKSITAGLGRLVEMLDPSAPAGKKIVGGLTILIDKFGKFVMSIDFEKFSDGVVSAMSFIEKAVEYGSAALQVLYALNPMHLLSEYNDFIVGVFKTIGNFFSSLYGIVAGYVDIIGPIASGIGSAIWQGIKNGLLGGVKAVEDTIMGLGQSIIDKMKGVLKVSSPSKVFAELGRHTTAGYQLGIEAGMPKVNAVMEHSFEPPEPTSAPGTRAGGSSNVHYEANVTVNVNGGTRESADAMALTIREQILRLFEHLQAEGASG